MGISTTQALDCFHSEDLIGIGMEADAVRRSLHPEGVVSYLVDRRIRIAAAGNGQASDDTAEAIYSQTIYAQAAETLELGGTGLHLELAPTAPLPAFDWLCALLSGLQQRFPALCLHGLSATAVVALAAAAQLSLRDTLIRLSEAGLNSLAGDDAMISQNIPWLEVHRIAHQIGLRSTAAMVFGLDETLAQRVDHLQAIRALQQETGGFTAFTPIAFHPDLHPGHVIPPIPIGWQPPTAVEYLRTLAISRMLLDNIAHIQSSSAAQGLKVVQMTLRFGGNDLGSISLEAGAQRSTNRVTEEDLRRVIRDAGFRPVQRDTLYRTHFLNH
jgi:cyclic dehypoxanthinyl futalosine synthase